MSNITDINSYVIDKDQTVEGFLSQFEIDSDFTPYSFLNLKLLSGLLKDKTKRSINVTNFDRIKSKYSADELKEVDGKLPKDIVIKAGTEVGLPNWVIRKQPIKTSLPPLFQQTDFDPFIPLQLYRLFKDPNYRSVVRSIDDRRITTIDNNDITVYAWIRSLSQSQQQSGKWVNLSPFIVDVQTNVAKEGGSFAFTLSPAATRFTKDGWELADIIGYSSNTITKDVLSSTNVSKYKVNEDNFFTRESIFGTTVLQENDLIYIKFERLLNEKEEDGYVNVVGNIWDMIGLIDSVSTSTASTDRSSDINISVQGRDLMKVLVEDGSYFFEEQFAQQTFIDPNSVLSKRNIIESIGDTNKRYPISYTFKTIESVLKFIFNKFSNLGLFPDSVLSQYGDRAIKSKYIITGKFVEALDDINKTYLQDPRQGIWQIIDFIFDPQVAERALVDNSVGQDNGSIINSIRKVIQEPWVEIYGDVYGDRYYFTIRKPPFDKKGYHGAVYGGLLTEFVGDGINSNSIVGVDPKIRQDQVDRNASRIANRGRVSSLSEFVIDIDESEVLSDNLTYHQEVYSWYRVEPINLRDSFLGLFAPVVPLDEYASVWGNRMFTYSLNYVPTHFVFDKDDKDNLEYLDAQMLYDLQFAIQSNAYLPFTRRGVIRIIGNRTIKRGMFIYYTPTDEVFHVDNVVNIRTVSERSTVLTVSRGMRERYIKGVDVDFPDGKEKVSYFNIVNTDVDSKASIVNTDFLKNWRVRPNVFNFFLTRRQWADE